MHFDFLKSSIRSCIRTFRRHSIYCFSVINLVWLTVRTWLISLILSTCWVLLSSRKDFWPFKNPIVKYNKLLILKYGDLEVPLFQERCNLSEILFTRSLHIKKQSKVRTYNSRRTYKKIIVCSRINYIPLEHNTG